MAIAAILGIVFQLFKQPAILAYILTGIIVGPFGQFQFRNTDDLHALAQLGITLLLFMVGLELRFSQLKSVGKVAIFTGLSQIFFTSLVGYVISVALGFPPLASLYIAVALTFSSTIIIVKLLSDKKDLNSLYGKISVGFLLVQDFVAILILIALSGFNQANGSTISLPSLGFVLLKGFLLFAFILYLSRTIFPRITDAIARSPETLFLFSIAWAFVVSSAVSAPPLGFSIEIGGFLAGLALANSSENFQIVARVRGLRDFFITIFFVLLGMNLVFTGISDIWQPALIFSAFILIGNPLIVMIIMGLMGYRKSTSFFAGLTVAQISEFSLIVIFLGSKLGHVSNDVVTLVTLVGVITFTLSSYMILYNNKLYNLLRPYLGVFELKKKKVEGEWGKEALKDHIVLIGANRTGRSILETLKEHSQKTIVIDFDPDVIKQLKTEQVEHLFGDITDLDIQEIAQLTLAKLIISTIPDFEDNLLLLDSLKHNRSKARVIVVAQDSSEAEELYKRGADYVVLPYLAGGRHIAKILTENHIDRIGQLKEKDLKNLRL